MCVIMKLDRSLIKSQAKEIIKGNVFKLFVIVFVVMLLAQGGNAINYTVDISKMGPINFFSSLFDNDYDDFDFGYDDSDDFDEFNGFNDGAGFSDDIFSRAPKSVSFVLGLFGAIGSLLSIAALFLAPLAITLMGVFYQLIKGNNMSYSDEFSFVFGKTFDKNYWNKFLLDLLKGIFMALLSLLFVIPGIIFYYKYYFTSFIMAEKPELSWKEAMEISKKMTKGHKGELFVLDLSFLGWDILVGITLGIVGIYVLPYVYTTQALYYENFKLRAYQTGEMTPQDYLTEDEKTALYYQNGALGANTYYQPQQNNAYYQPQQSNVYQQTQNNTFGQTSSQGNYEPYKNEYNSSLEQQENQPVEENGGNSDMEAEDPAQPSDTTLDTEDKTE